MTALDVVLSLLAVLGLDLPVAIIVGRSINLRDRR